MWTAPKTWTAATLSVADMNTHVRDNLNYLKGIADTSNWKTAAFSGYGSPDLDLSLDSHTIVLFGTGVVTSNYTTSTLAGGVAGRVVIFKNVDTTFSVIFNHLTAGGFSSYQNVVTGGPTIIAPGGSIAFAHDGSVWQYLWHQQGAPLAYTPLWTSSGTPIGLGNATLVGQYIVRAKRVSFNIKLTMGSTTTYGTGNYLFSVPFAAQAGWTFREMGWTAQDISAGGVVYMGHAEIGLFSGFGVTGMVTAATATAAAMGQLVPFTWAVGDLLSFSGSYDRD